MVTIPRGTRDRIVSEIEEVLHRYEVEHPKSKASLYRQNAASVRIRIIDPAFARMPKSERHERVWQYLGELSEDTQADISMLLLLAPGELKISLGNFEFDDPIPSNL